MSLRRILILARRVIQQLMADRRTIGLILIVPLVVLTVAGILVRAETTGPAIAVVLEDEGASVPLLGNVNLGERLTESLSNLSDVLDVRVMSADEAQAALENGDLDAVVTLPADFSAQAVASRELNIPVLYEGSNPTAARLLEGMFTRGAVQTLASLSALGAQTATTTPPVHLQATYRYGSPDFDTLDYLAPVFIGLFVFLFVFILTSVAFLRERAAGTLERLLATPVGYIEVVVGYMLGFAVFALLQSVIILGFTILVLKVHYSGSLAAVFVVEALLALMAVNLGIFFSTFARNEFQVMQFIPLVTVTQILLSGAFWPVEAMPVWLQPVSWLMPLTHANRALRDVMIKGFDLIQVGPFVLVLLAFIVGLVVLASRTVRQQA